METLLLKLIMATEVATIGTEAKRVAKSYAQDVLYEFSELYLDVAERFWL